MPRSKKGAPRAQKSTTPSDVDVATAFQALLDTVNMLAKRIALVEHAAAMPSIAPPDPFPWKAIGAQLLGFLGAENEQFAAGCERVTTGAERSANIMRELVTSFVNARAELDEVKRKHRAPADQESVDLVLKIGGAVETLTGAKLSEGGALGIVDRVFNWLPQEAGGTEGTTVDLVEQLTALGQRYLTELSVSVPCSRAPVPQAATKHTTFCDASGCAATFATTGGTVSDHYTALSEARWKVVVAVGVSPKHYCPGHAASDDRT